MAKCKCKFSSINFEFIDASIIDPFFDGFLPVGLRGDFNKFNNVCADLKLGEILDLDNWLGLLFRTNPNRCRNWNPNALTNGLWDKAARGFWRDVPPTVKT